jgi:hypothetical protein
MTRVRPGQGEWVAGDIKEEDIYETGWVAGTHNDRSTWQRKKDEYIGIHVTSDYVSPYNGS